MLQCSIGGLTPAVVNSVHLFRMRKVALDLLAASTSSITVLPIDLNTFCQLAQFRRMARTDS